MNTTSVRKKHVQIVTSMDAGKREPKIPPTTDTKPIISVFFTTPLPSLLQRKSSLVESTFFKIMLDKISIVALTKTKSMVSSPPVTSNQFLCLLRLSSRRREAMFPIVQRSQLTATDSVPKLFFKILLHPRSGLLDFFLMTRRDQILYSPYTDDALVALTIFRWLFIYPQSSSRNTNEVQHKDVMWPSEHYIFDQSGGPSSL